MKNLQTKNSKPEFTLDMVDAIFAQLLAIIDYDWERFYDDMVPIEASEDVMKVMYLLMVMEQLLPESDRLSLHHTLVEWAFTEKRLGKEDWISYTETDPLVDMLSDKAKKVWNGEFDDTDLDDDEYDGQYNQYESEDEYYERYNECETDDEYYECYNECERIE